MTSIDALLQLPDVLRLRAALAARPGVRITTDDSSRRLAAIVQSSEVAESFWVPLAALRERAAWGTAMVPVRGHGERQVTAFRHGAYTVWGLTERVLRQFLEYLDGAA